MTKAIGFWTPVKFEGTTSLGQKAQQFSDAYFNFGNKVAVVLPGSTKKGSTEVKLQMHKAVYWHTAIKVAAFFTLIIPALMLIIKVVARSLNHYHICTQPPVQRQREPNPTADPRVEETARPEEVPPERPPVAPEPQKRLFRNVWLEQEEIELNFAEETIDGRREVIPVQRAASLENFGAAPFVRASRSAREVLLKLAQDTSYSPSPIKLILQHPNNHLLQPKEFLQYLLTANRGKLPIDTLSASSLMEVLELAKEHGVAIDLHAVDEDTQESLFTKWAGRGYIELTNALLAFDPTAIRQSQGSEVSCYTKALLEGNEDEAAVLLGAMQQQNMQLSESEQWAQKANTNNCDFRDDAFQGLPEALKRKLFQIANIYVCREFLFKLRHLGMQQPPAQPEGAALLSHNMDAITVEDTLQGFLQNLRKEGLLLTKEEFAQKERTQFVHKGNDMSRILGRDYIERTATRLQLPFIKVPKKTVVFTPVESSLSFHFHGGMIPKNDDIEIYAEKIERVDRPATQAEMTQLLDLLAATGYKGFSNDNFFIGKNPAGVEGLYFIDTQSDNFLDHRSYTHYKERLRSLMSEENHPWLNQEMQRRFLPLIQQRGERMKNLQQRPEPQDEYGFAARRKPFTFKLDAF